MKWFLWDLESVCCPLDSIPCYHCSLLLVNGVFWRETSIEIRTSIYRDFIIIISWTQDILWMPGCAYENKPHAAHVKPWKIWKHKQNMAGTSDFKPLLCRGSQIHGLIDRHSTWRRQGKWIPAKVLYPGCSCSAFLLWMMKSSSQGFRKPMVD